MNKQIYIIIHIAVWLILFLSPITFMRDDESLSLTRILIISVQPVALMMIFYLNYCWLTPHYFVKGERRLYFFTNIVLIIVLAIAVHFWLNYAHSLFNNDHGNHEEPTLYFHLSFILNNAIQLFISAAIATTIQLSLRWQHSESARIAAEAAKTEAELKNLRWQMNPHFMLNTLNNIYALTAIDTNKAQETIHELSLLLRHVLYNNQQPYISLTNEIEFLENYIKLMKIRMYDNVKISFHTDTNSLKQDKQIAPLIFISLVENAFKHGISTTQNSFIDISLIADQQHIDFSISNSNFPKDAKDNSGHGIGLEQVKKRLELYYPNAYTFKYGLKQEGKIYFSHIIINT